ncbi:DNA mismatch repair protein MutS [Tenacibaculum holothuriorum]|uniref:DNA mismatch repair protein MutS n=1 Tax=Tenacibaculum holothuriorum TaxID=1635173 RepID=A0A1Y2PBM3_9FLAO|nr:Smr/MutS family protein [Tenacibaculum holothuriorum]OSY87874.1 DNA mismatch repair protein MutS [Tenacibaculum holothuriorum]
MRLEIGNKVAVLDDVIKGYVIKIEKETVFIKDEEGMEYRFLASELVKLEEEQSELSKYSDINNKMLREKVFEVKKKKTPFVKQKNEVVMEVDLHAEKLVKSTRGMDNYDILTLQIDAAKAKLEYCIRKKISKIVFIHGVGEGVLKTELHFMLNNYPVKYYDASYQKYGLGATEVYIYQNAI